MDWPWYLWLLGALWLFFLVASPFLISFVAPEFKRRWQCSDLAVLKASVLVVYLGIVALSFYFGGFEVGGGSLMKFEWTKDSYAIRTQPIRSRDPSDPPDYAFQKTSPSARPQMILRQMTLGGRSISSEPLYQSKFIKPAPLDDSVRRRLEDEAFDLANGKLAFDVHNKMKQAQSERPVVRIARGVDDAIATQLKNGLSDAAQVDDIQVAPFMIVHLEAAEKSAFEITPLTQDRQFLLGNGYATWAWSVMPLEAGKHTLYLSVGTRIKLPGGNEETHFRPLYEKDISVQIDRMYETEQFVSSYWQWLSATLVLPLLAFLWPRLRRKPKITTLDP